MSAVLENILVDVRARLATRKHETSLSRMRALAEDARQPRDFARALADHSPAIIAEVKRASPSMGAIAADADPVQVARDYVANGAAALSVLTERDHFGGSPDVLRAVRAALPDTLLLMKDFVVDPYQLFEARALGADCVLLMVIVLGDATGTYLAQARELGLSALVEVHDACEMQIAKDAGARLIGVNNRDLTTMRVDIQTGVRLAGLAPKHLTLVAESGIATGDDVKTLAAAGFDAFLVGTSLMRTGEPGAALARLRAAMPQRRA